MRRGRQKTGVIPMSRTGRLQYHLGNILFFFGVLLIALGAITAFFGINAWNPNEGVWGISGTFLVTIGVAITVVGLVLIRRDRMASEGVVVIGVKEQHTLQAKLQGSYVVLHVDEEPELRVKRAYFRWNTGTMVVGRKEKHEVALTVRSSAWTGETDKYISVDGVLAHADERPWI